MRASGARSAAALELPGEGKQAATNEPRVESERGTDVLERVRPVLAALHHPATGLDREPGLVLRLAADRPGEAADRVREHGAEQRALAARALAEDETPRFRVGALELGKTAEAIAELVAKELT